MVEFGREVERVNDVILPLNISLSCVLALKNRSHKLFFSSLFSSHLAALPFFPQLHIPYTNLFKCPPPPPLQPP